MKRLPVPLWSIPVLLPLWYISKSWESPNCNLLLSPSLTLLVKVETPDTFNWLNTDVPVVLIPAAAPPLIPVNWDPSPLKLVAVIIPEALICLEDTSTTDILGVPLNPAAVPSAFPVILPVKLPTKDEAVIDPLVFIVCVIAPDVSPTIISPDLVGRTTETLPEYSEWGADFNLV